MSDRLAEYADVFRQPGPWCLAYVQASTGTVDTLEAGDVLPGNVRTALAAQGASNADLDAMEEAVRPAAGEPSRVSRFVLVRQGAVAIDELLPGPPVVPERISVDAIADLLPLVKHRPEVFPYVVAEVSRDEGEIRLHPAGRQDASDTREIHGSSENLSKVPGGGWSQGQFQHRTEEIWRRNADQLAEEIGRTVRDSHARLLIVAGDIRARGLVVDQLSEAGRAVLTILESHTRTPGADHEKYRRARPTPSQPPGWHRLRC